MAGKTAKKASTASASDETWPTFQGEPDTSYGFTLAGGQAREIDADADGVVQAESAADVAFFRTHGLKEIKSAKSAPTKAAPTDTAPADKPAETKSADADKTADEAEKGA